MGRVSKTMLSGVLLLCGLMSAPASGGETPLARNPSDLFVIGIVLVLSAVIIAFLFRQRQRIPGGRKPEEEMNNLYASLKLEKDFSDAIFNSAATGIMVLDGDGQVLKINQSGATMLRTDVSELMGRRITDFFPETSDMLAASEGLRRELTLSLPDGASVPVGFNSSSLFDPARSRECTLVMFRDMSEIKRLQAELRKKEHFETMGKVVSGVAHEIRNPLFGISSIGQILDREIESPQHKALLHAMMKEANRMNQLIEELLLYTRPSRLEVMDIDVRILFDEMLYFIREKRGGITIDIDIPPLLTIRADRHKITQVFLNLLNNALEAASERITISGGSTRDETEVRITDDGPGIGEDDLGRIFEPFFTTKKSGTGLGLPICKKIVEDHGGIIDIQSVNGKGTSAVITFQNHLRGDT